MVSVGAAWAVWSMMRCNAGRMAGSTAVGWLLAGSQLLWAVPDGGNDDGCGVGSAVVRSASGVVGAGARIGVGHWCGGAGHWCGLDPASVWSRR